MKITDIKVRFIPDQRPRILVTFDKPLDQADLLYIAAYEKDHKLWVYRGQDGEYIHCGAEVKPAAKGFKQDRVRMKDGWHPVWPLQPTNSVAVNSLFRFMPPVMEAEIQTHEEGYTHGHVDAIAVARYLYAAGTQAAAEGATEAACMAVLEWPSGVRVYEPVLATKDLAGTWQAEPNRAGDTFQFLATPGDPLSPILAALKGMK